MYTANCAILALHFSKYKYLAFTAVALGIRVGTIVWPVASQFLLTSYGYSKAMGMMAIPQIMQIIAGILFFEPSKHDEKPFGDKSKNSSGKIC